MMLGFLRGRGFPWPKYGTSRQIANITGSGLETTVLPADLHARCDMINRVILDPSNGV